MNPNRVLVRGVNSNKALARAIADAGFDPILTRDMNTFLSELRKGGFAAVLVDRVALSIDVLEMVLNIRDFDENVPIIVIGKIPDERNERALFKIQGTFLIPRTSSAQELTDNLSSIMNMKRAL